MNLTHRHRLRVIYAQTDRMNVVYYSRYYEFFEAARGAFMRRINLPYEQLEREGIFLPVVESHCRHFLPATYEDLLTIETRLDDEPKAKVKLSYRIYKEGVERPIAEGYTIHSFVNKDLKRVEVPEAFLVCIRRYAGQVLEDEASP
ncbi:MAG: acyl-CoA thioesterase [Fidelibacterota bacterium]|nr:MAG: acyl-CoA thioesterase [Candidatus Neomarinimicrobiota bacterium]